MLFAIPPTHEYYSRSHTEQLQYNMYEYKYKYNDINVFPYEPVDTYRFACYGQTFRVKHLEPKTEERVELLCWPKMCV